MDITKWLGKVMETAKKYRYALLVLLLGVSLMCWPSTEHKGEDSAPTEVTAPASPAFLEEKELEAILSRISGAGEVMVLLSYSSGEKTIYHQDESSGKTQTVILSDSNRKESAVVKQVIGPTYLGAIVLCSGADQPSVKLSIVEAVSKVTGLGSDHICVLKMK